MALRALAKIHAQYLRDAVTRVHNSNDVHRSVRAVARRDARVDVFLGGVAVFPIVL